MKSWLWLRFLGISLFFALILSALYLNLVRQVAGPASNEVQRSLYLFIAKLAEVPPYPQSLQHIAVLGAQSPALQMDLWVIDQAGRVIASRTVFSANSGLPPEFSALEKPRAIHDVVTKGRFFSGAPAVALIRLKAVPPTYLAVRNRGISGGNRFALLSIFFLFTLMGAVFLGLLLVTLYLRARSREAGQILSRMNDGDLSARFTPGRLDSTGRLMLDFNRMADEIERLVRQLQATERTRRELLQELGHDLRTPLTSLRTAIETLLAHGNTMSGPERQELFNLIAAEFNYFSKLTDDLFFIAELEQPRYRHTAERLDIWALLIQAETQIKMQAELQAEICRQLPAAPHVPHVPHVPSTDAQAAIGPAHLTFIRQDWRIHNNEAVTGDPILISRLLRNVLENAARYARSSVMITLKDRPGYIDILIEDDGAGMSAATMAAFGHRRSQRVLAARGDYSASLGLGSVIIDAIIKLHGGSYSLESSASDAALNGLSGRLIGTRMTLSLPAVPSPAAVVPVSHRG